MSALAFSPSISPSNVQTSAVAGRLDRAAKVRDAMTGGIARERIVGVAWLGKGGRKAGREVSST